MAFSFRVGTNWCHDFPKLARESGFYFNMHKSKVRMDWNRISNIDIDRIIRERDFSIVDENINNVIDYCLESEYDIKILDPNFVKLFRLAQLAVEYLLYCKQYLDHSVVILKDELKLKIEENVKLKKEITASEEVIKRLKEKSKEKGKLVETKIGDCNGEIYKCPHCSKTFISAMFVSAHIARRHAYASDLFLTSSPIHEHYRTETEKLHNEIKSLKERLNQAEKVIRNESNRIPEKSKTDYETRLSENENESFKRDVNKSREHQEHKGYQDEISSLKTMLFDEIHNLRQRDRTIYEHASETNVQTLMNQQEKEFQKLRNQLLERLTPDIESMNAKLHAQEDYWRSKIEHLEYQHHKDVEKLTTELKLTQKASDHIKAEYESKVSDLERQSANQSNILQEQSKQLHSLSREINNPQSEGCKNSDHNLQKKSSQSVTLQQQSDLNHKDQEDAKTEQIVIEDVDSVSSMDSTGRIVSLISQNKFLQKNVQASQRGSKTTKSHDNEGTKQRSTRHVKNSNKMFENVKNIERNLKNSESSDFSESRDSTQEKPINYHTKHTKYDVNDRSSIKSSYFDESRTTESEDALKKDIVRTFSTDEKNNKTAETLEDDLTSDTKSESATLDSRTESESESVSTIRKNPPIHENKTSSLSLSKSKKVTRHSTSYKKLQMDLQEMFDKKLRDLGIDPEWQGIPKATFKQKMDILNHHQKITAKKLPKYHQIKLKIIEEILDKISRKSKEVENFKSVKKSSLGKLVSNVKSKAIKAFSSHKSPEDPVSILKLQGTTPKKLYSQPKFHHPPKDSNEDKNFETTKEPLILSRNKNMINSYDHLKAMKSPEILNHRSIENQMKFSPSLIKSHEDAKRVKNSYDSSNEMRSWFDAVQHKITSTPNNKEILSTKSLENDNLNGSNTHSPRNNKSVLKSTTGSTGSLVKKKVIFDLTNNKGGKSSSEYNIRQEELNDSDWNSSSISDDEEQPVEVENYRNISNIVLKTAQSDKIAEISRKLEAQLRMVRQKPAGSVETIFSSKYVQDKENHDSENQQVSSTNVRSLLESTVQTSALKSKTTNDSFPQPAPRNLKDKGSETVHAESTSEGSDLDSDIDKILNLE